MLTSLKQGDRLITDTIGKAEALTDQYQSVFTKEPPAWTNTWQRTQPLLSHGRPFHHRSGSAEATTKHQGRQSHWSRRHCSQSHAGDCSRPGSCPHHHLHALNQRRGGTWGLEEGKCHPDIQERLKVLSLQLPTRLSRLYLLQSNGTHNGMQHHGPLRQSQHPLP